MSEPGDDDDAQRGSSPDATRVDRPERRSNPAIPTAATAPSVPSDVTVPTRVTPSSSPEGPEFGPRYRLIGVLGKGGMGEVFRAYDTELREEVAIKVVRDDIGDPDASLARFRREIALAR